MRRVYYPQLASNEHLTTLRQRFGDLRSEWQGAADIRYVFLCFTNRCGSNYLAELFAADGINNQAGENFNFDTVALHCGLRSLGSFHAYFHWLVSHQQKNGRMFVKVAPAHLELLGEAGILDHIIDRSAFVLIERSDKLGQAISAALAFATGRYTSWMEGSGKPEDVPFSVQRIDAIIDEIAGSYRLFDLFFARNGLQPVISIYESLVESPRDQLAALVARLGLTGLAGAPGKLRLERQASAVNDLWRERYLAHPASRHGRSAP